MHLVLIIIGGFFGLVFGSASEELLGAMGGAVLGYLVYRNMRLRSAIDELRRDLDGSPAAAGRSTPEPRRETPPVPAAKPVQDAPPAFEQAPSEPAAPVSTPPPVPDAAPIPATPRPTVSPSGLVAAKTATEPAAMVTDDRPQNPVDRLIDAAREWITTGNVPVKVGLIVLFFGVAFLLKYAIDQKLFNLPIEIRLLAVAAGGVTLLVLGWRLREKSRVYALNLQGGGIGVLYLTIFAAFRLWTLLPVSVAFGLLVMLTIAGGVLAVMQNARGLAVMASVGGFLAPVLVSTGSGNHVALFSYYLLLNCAILGISWYRAWRSLNLIGFVFTFGVGTIWGFQYYTPELYASTQPFLILNFLFYQAIAILFAFRQTPELRGLVDGTIIFGTPAIAFSLQAQLVVDTEYGLAISAAAVALFYAGVALWLYRMHSERMRLLMQSFTVLGSGFATIALPLALDDRWSAIAWALEGAGVVWLGVRQNGMLARVSGTALIFLSGYFYLEHGWRDGSGWPIVNGNVLGGVLIAAAALLAARWLRDDKHKLPIQVPVSIALFFWALGWWFGTGVAEIDDRAGAHEADLVVLFTAATALGVAWLARRDAWTIARFTSFASLPVFILFGAAYAVDFDHFLVGWGWFVWPAVVAAYYAVLRFADDTGGQIMSVLHAAAMIGIAGLLAYEVPWWMRDAGHSYLWNGSAEIASQLALVTGLLYLRKRIAWPLARYPIAYLSTASILTVLQLFVLLVMSIETSGDPHPMPYIPLLNPLDLLMIASLMVAAWCVLVWRDAVPTWSEDQVRVVFGCLGGVAFTLSTLAVVRLVHHFGDVPWDGFALRRSVSVQAALSIYWALLGVAGMVIGTRRSHYWIWLVGVGLMGVVVLKLFFVDLGNTGTVARIVSFIGVGALLLVVGYYAPRPPRPWGEREGPAET